MPSSHLNSKPHEVFLIYSRKSSEAEDRQILSIESQVKELKELAERLQIPISDVLTEAQSAKAPGRPVFNQMMERIQRSEVAGVLCWKLDRLARNPVDGGAIMWAIKDLGLKIITPTQTYSHDADNSILTYIEFGMAQKTIDDLSRNVKRGNRAKLDKGWYPSIVPLGYLNNKYKDRDGKDIVSDPERFLMVRKMWDLMLSGAYTPPRIAEIANQKWEFRTRQTKKMGNKPLTRSGIYALFTNPFYSGSFEYPKGSGQWYKGAHEPMVTQEEYDRAQILLGRNGKPRPQRHSFPFTGMICCGECGSMVTAEEKHQMICSACKYKFSYRGKDECPRCHAAIEEMKSPTILFYTYYHCTKRKNPSCSQRSIEYKELQQQIDEYLSTIRISEGAKEWAIGQLQNYHDHEMKGRDAIIESQQKRYQECVGRLENLIRLKTSPDNAAGVLLSDQEYAEQRQALLKEKAHLEDLFRDTGHRIDQWLELSEKTFQFACYAQDWFVLGDIQQKREILSAIGSNLTLRDKKLRIEAKNPFLILEESVPGLCMPKELFEPENNGSIKAQSVAFDDGLRSKLALMYDVRTFNRIVRKVWRFFKESPGHHYIPIFNERDSVAK